MANTSINSMEFFKEGEWVILHQLNNRRLARVGRKGFASLGKDCVSLEGAIGCLPWTNFKMEPQTGSKTGKRTFSLVPVGEGDEMDSHDEELSDTAEEDKDNRTINDDGQSQSLSSLEIEALREGGLTGKEIVNQLVAGSATYDRKTRYAKSKYLRKKESKHCLRERVCIRKTSLSSVAEVLCSGGGGEGSRGSIIGMRPDTLSQMLTALNIQWKRIKSVITVQKVASSTITKPSNENIPIVNEESLIAKLDTPNIATGAIDLESSIGRQRNLCNEEDDTIPTVNCISSEGTTYIVYESGNWGLLVASLLTYLPSSGPRLIHLYPGHGVPCLIAPRALNLPHEKLSILSSVNLKALLEKLRNTVNNNTATEKTVKDHTIEEKADEENNFSNTKEKNAQVTIGQEQNKMQKETDRAMEDSSHSGTQQEMSCGTIQLDRYNDKHSEKSRKRKLENSGESEEFPEDEIVGKKPRWELEAELAAAALTSCKADGLAVVACREHPVSIVLSLLPFLAPSRPLVVYCPYREPLLDLYAVLKGWEPWVGRYGGCGGKDGIPRVANLRVTENWLRNYQVLPNRTHPEVNMSPGGGFILTGVIIDFSDE